MPRAQVSRRSVLLQDAPLARNAAAEGVTSFVAGAAGRQREGTASRPRRRRLLAVPSRLPPPPLLLSLPSCHSLRRHRSRPMSLPARHCSRRRCLRLPASSGACHGLIAGVCRCRGCRVPLPNRGPFAGAAAAVPPPVAQAGARYPLLLLAVGPASPPPQAVGAWMIAVPCPPSMVTATAGSPSVPLYSTTLVYAPLCLLVAVGSQRVSGRQLGPGAAASNLLRVPLANKPRRRPDAVVHGRHRRQPGR